MSFTDAVHGVLSDPSSLPAEFLDYMIQYQAQNALPTKTLQKINVFNVRDYGAVGDNIADDTASLQAAANAAAQVATGAGGILHLPPGLYKITSPILISAGVSVLGSGLSSRIQPVGCDGLHLQAPWTSIGPYFIRDLFFFGSGCTNFAAIRVDGATQANQFVSGYEISNVDINGFGYGLFLRSLWRSSFYQVRMVNVYYGVYIQGQNVMLNFNGVYCDSGTPPGTPTGATNSTGFFCDAAFDYNPGGNTQLRPESIHVNNSQFINFAIGIDHVRCLIGSYEGVDLDSCSLYGIRYNQSDGGLRFKGDWLALTGTSAAAGILAVDIPAGQSKSIVEIDGFNITSYNASTGSIGIQIGDLQNNVVIRSCCIGSAGGLADFQSADISISGVSHGTGNTNISIVDTVCGSTTPANSLVVGSTGAVTGRGTSLNLAKAISVGATSTFPIDSGKEIGYDQITANVSVTGTTPATATTIIAAAGHTFDGQPVLLEFYSPAVITPSVASGAVHFGIYESGTLIAELCDAITPAAANMRVALQGRFRFSPTAGVHTYVIAAWASSTTGTPQVGAGTGTGGAFTPAYLRFTKV